jgi:hypothetical protein
MANTASTTFPKSQPIPERSTRLYRCALQDVDGNLITPAQITSIRFSLRDDKTDKIINGRNRIEVFNQNGGSFDGNGLFNMILDTLDTVTTSKAKIQKRRAVFEVIYLNGIENHEVFFYIENLEDLPPAVLSPLIALLGFTGLSPKSIVA